MVLLMRLFDLTGQPVINSACGASTSERSTQVQVAYTNLTPA